MGTIDSRGLPVIHFKPGDIVEEDAEALVNAVNCVGVMGRGIALQFRQAFPENFRAYAEACSRGGVRPGNMMVEAERSEVLTQSLTLARNCQKTSHKLCNRSCGRAGRVWTSLHSMS